MPEARRPDSAVAKLLPKKKTAKRLEISSFLYHRDKVKRPAGMKPDSHNLRNEG